MSMERDRKCQEREKLKNIIVQWNANRLDLFALSEPNEELEFHGVMRFYFQDAGQKVATKCIRVSSTASTQDCVETLIEKFRPDIRMLSVPEYALYEIHENGDERKLNEEEKPLLVQLNWHKDDREGRFLLRRMDEKSYLPSIPEANCFKRKLSKREKKEKKRREKKERIKTSEENKRDGIAERLYSELPENRFTRSISNPEAVMRRRRQQKLEKKLQQFRQEGGTDAGGTLRIFGENLNKDVPYKTLLLSTKDTAAYVVKEILEKYGHDKEDPTQYCLVQAIIPASSLDCEEELQEYHSSIPGVREYILDDDDCPLAIERQHNRTKGILVFHVKRRPADYQPRKRKKKPKPTKSELDGSYKYEDLEKLPYLLELNPDGSDILGIPKKHRLYLNVTEVGSERSSSTGGQCLQLFGPNVQPRHCVIAHTESIITVTPSSRDAETYVNGTRIYETTILQHGMVVRFGKLHTFRFVDPIHDQKRGMTSDLRQTADYMERNRRKDDQLSVHHGGYETTFDADGNVETVSTHSKDDRMSRKSDDVHSHRSLGRESSQGQGSYEKFDQRCGNDPIMPALLEFWEEGEDAFLSAIITQLDPSQVQFKVAPTYTLYMAARYRASTHFRPETTPSDRAHRLTALMNKVASMVHQVIQDRYRDAGSLAFWLANASELLHFLKQDRHLSAYTLDAQDVLAESVQLAFRSLVTCQQSELLKAMPAFLEDRDDVSEEEGTTADVLAVLSSAMSLLRRCRVNAALTIQLFSQLFHYINMWLFNQVISDARPNLCTRLWGVRFKRRLARIESWAEKQGLELAADCHLSRIVQAAHLLQAPKSSPDDIASISSSCFKLNSLQLFTLLERYRPVPDEPRIPRDLIESVVKVAENTADELARSDGREIKLDEDADLQLPFLLPEDGYSCDIVRGVPTGLQEFLQPLVQAGLCDLSIQTSSSGYWTIYMSDQDIGHFPPRACSPSVHSHVGDGEGSGRGSALPPEPEVSTIRLQKSNNGIGLSIVAAGGVDQDKLGIYVKSVVKGGAADLDGRLQAGDQLLKVDGQSLVGISQEKAAELMTRTGPVVTLEVAKQGAIYHGLQALLSKPSPVMPRGLPHPYKNQDRQVITSFSHLVPNWQSHSIQQTSCFSYYSTSRLERNNPISSKLNSATASPVVPSRQWEVVQTLDRTIGHSKQKKGHVIYEHNPFSYTKGILEGPLTNCSTSTPKTIEEVSKENRPKSDESLLEHPDGCSCPQCCPSCRWELITGRPWSDESIGSNPRSCSCEECCPTCRWQRYMKGRQRNARLPYEVSFCEICQRNYQAYQQSLFKPMKVEAKMNIPALAHCGCYMCNHGTSTSWMSVIVNDVQKKKSMSVTTSNYFITQPLENMRNGTQSKQHQDFKQKSYHSSIEGLLDKTDVSKANKHSSFSQLESTSLTNMNSEAPIRSHRMSERDIPSRVMHDPSYDPRFLGVPGARIQSSKSVPSLNSGHSVPETVRQPTNTNSRSHEVYNPAYSRTSSTTSIPKATEFSGSTPSDASSRSKSANNLRQETLSPNDRYPYVPPGQCPPPAYSATVGPLGNRPVSQPNLQPQQIIQEERHYQNISMYQQANNHSLPRPAPQQYSQNQQSHVKTIHGSHSSLNRPEHQQLSSQSSLERSRPLSTLVSPREQEQYVNSLSYAHGSGPALPPPPPSPHRSQSGHTGSDFRPSPQGHSQRTSDGREFHSHQEHFINEIIPENASVDDHYQRGFPPNYNHSHSHSQQSDSRQRDLIRQEAKMEEMREEVRRREERERMQQPSQVWPSVRPPQPIAFTQQNRQIPPAYSGPVPYTSPGIPQNTRTLTPTLKPRPNPGNDKLQRQYGHNNRHDSTPESHMVFQDPSSAAFIANAHSLLGTTHQRAPPPAVSYRYGPSGYPPRLTDAQQNPVRPVLSDPRLAIPFSKQSMIQSTQGQRQIIFDNLHSPTTGYPASQDKKDMSTLASPSPWEREEKEKLQKQRLEEARHVRDEEIRELENLQRRNPKQEERLRTLRLEKEFQRRAEELHGDEEEEDDEELLDRAESRERMLKMQEDLERARQRRLEWEQEQNQKHIVLTPQEEWKHRQQDKQHSQIEEQEDRLKQLRLEEVSRKKELEAAKEVEEQLLKEARRRQDEENRVQRTLLQQRHNPNIPPPYGTHGVVSVQTKTELTMNNQHDIPPPLPTSPPPVEPGYTNHFSQTNTNHELAHTQYGPSQSSGSQRLDNLLLVTSTQKSLSLQQSTAYNDKPLGPPPAPPERKSSYDVTNHMNSNTRLVNTSSLRNGDGGSHPHQPKKVSFHDSQLETEVTYDANGNRDQDENNIQPGITSGQEQTQMNYTSNSGSQSYTIQDIDEVLATPHNSQNLNTYSAGSTPGVIGAQEIYRDPRQRIEAERLQHHFEYGKSTGPEKLTFREKMKMFAMETGQQESPKDKVKISRAQRNIETNLNGT